MLNYGKNYLNINNVSNFVHFHICGQRDDSMSSELAGEQVPGASPVTFGVGHFYLPWTEMKVIYENNGIPISII